MSISIKDKGPAFPAKKTAGPNSKCENYKCALSRPSQLKFSIAFQLAEEIQRAFCVAWSCDGGEGISRTPGHRGANRGTGGPAKPRGYVIKTLDAPAGAGVLRRHCERDPIPAHTGDGCGRSDGDVSSYRSSPRDPGCQLRL